MVSDTAFIFHMCAPCGKTFSTKVKIKYQRHFSSKMAVVEELTFHKHILFTGECFKEKKIIILV